MATNTKLQGVVTSGIHHGINGIFAFWDVQQLRLIVTEVSGLPIAASSKVKQLNYQYMLCDMPDERSMLISRRIPEKYTLTFTNNKNSNFTPLKSVFICIKCDCFEVVKIHTAYLANILEKFRYELEGLIQQLLLEDGGEGIQSAHCVRTRSNVSAIRRTAAFTR
jgi:hypothetical protein